MATIGTLLDWAAALLAIFAGIGLATSRTVGQDSYLQVIANGIGLYFIAKGWFMARSLWLQSSIRGRLPKSEREREVAAAIATEDARA